MSLVSMIIGLVRMEKYCLDIKSSLHVNKQFHAVDECICVGKCLFFLQLIKEDRQCICGKTLFSQKKRWFSAV